MFSKVVLASNNAGKLNEFNHLFSTTGIEFVAQGKLGVSDAIEDGLSFVENAIIKARHACRETRLPALADDSGLEVDYLDGEPGIFSARYAGEQGNDALNNQLLLSKLKGVEKDNRSARFQCVLAFMRHESDPTPLICQASWEGYILEEEQGQNGFGYDPLFWIPEKNCSSAELQKEEKNKISHRAQAMKILLASLKKNYEI